MISRAEGKAFESKDTIYPNVYDGAEGMMFIEKCVASSNDNGAWLPFRYDGARR